MPIKHIEGWDMATTNSIDVVPARKSIFREGPSDRVHSINQ